MVANSSSSRKYWVQGCKRFIASCQHSSFGFSSALPWSDKIIHPDTQYIISRWDVMQLSICLFLKVGPETLNCRMHSKFNDVSDASCKVKQISGKAGSAKWRCKQTPVSITVLCVRFCMLMNIFETGANKQLIRWLSCIRLLRAWVLKWLILICKRKPKYRAYCVITCAALRRLLNLIKDQTQYVEGAKPWQTSHTSCWQVLKFPHIFPNTHWLCLLAFWTVSNSFCKNPHRSGPSSLFFCGRSK